MLPHFPVNAKQFVAKKKEKQRKGLHHQRHLILQPVFLTWHGLITAVHIVHLTGTLLSWEDEKEGKKRLKREQRGDRAFRRLNCCVLLRCGVWRHPTIPFAGSIFTTSTLRQNFQALTWKNCLTYLQTGPVIYALAMELLWFVYVYVLTGCLWKWQLLLLLLD